MDIITHAIVGAVTGSTLGYPVTGAFAGIAPDLVMGWRRREVPPAAYNLSHSALFTLGATAIQWAIYGETIAAVTFLALVSHLFLDFFTHGVSWGSPLLYPFSHYRFSPLGEEWEFFNDVWWLGLFLAVSWCIVALCVI